MFYFCVSFWSLNNDDYTDNCVGGYD
jgi:hypothetical protein